MLNAICQKLAASLTVERADWKEIFKNETEMNLSVVNFDAHQAKIFVPTVENPFYEIRLSGFFGRATIALRRH
ncbi:MAG: hypothetical protein WKF71_02970 [Pyrinomonadaceae bacterium]